MAKTPAWQRKEGKSKSGGLNAKKELHLIVQLTLVLN
jgi:hypothetical protein